MDDNARSESGNEIEPKVDAADTAAETLPVAVERLHMIVLPTLSMVMVAILIYVGVTGGLSNAFWYGAVVCHLVSLFVFKNFVAALTYGYGLALIALSVLTAVFYAPGLEAQFALAAVFAYGLRMTVFTWRRERHGGYKRRKGENKSLDSKLGIPARIGIWLGVAWMYACYAFPLQMTTRESASTTMLWVAGTLAWLGLFLEIAADRQKWLFKVKHGDRFCDVGLYRLCRFPNYAAEIVFQCGILVAGLAGAIGWMDFAAASVVPIIMFVVMAGQVLTLRFEQKARYKDVDGFAEYTKRTPALLPKFF